MYSNLTYGERREGRDATHLSPHVEMEECFRAERDVDSENENDSEPEGLP